MLDGFDPDGVWGQIELRNEPLLQYARSQLRKEQKTEMRARKEEAEERTAARLPNGCAPRARRVWM